MPAVLDPYGSNSIAASIPNLISNLASGASTATLPVGPNGRVEVDWTTRLPLVLVVLKQTLEDHTSVLVHATLDPANANEALGTFEFGPFTERGAALPVRCPLPGTVVPAFTLGFKVERKAEDGALTAIADADADDWIEVMVAEGNFGRLLFALNAEKARLRRQAREGLAMRRLNLVRRDALDRMGAEVGVARAEEQIVFDAAANEVVSKPYLDGAAKVMEPDADYARRLRIYRPFLMPSRKYQEARLNDEGLMSGVGYAHKVSIGEAQNSFAVALHLVDVNPSGRIANFQKYLEGAVLVYPANTPPANNRHAARMLSAQNLLEVAEMRQRLRADFTFPNTLGLAPMLAGAMDRAGRVTRALGVAVQWEIKRGHDPAAGSRYQLGLGLDLAMPTTAQIDSLRAAVGNGARAVTGDDAAEALIRDLQAEPIPSNADDPSAAWFWSTCGLQTVHRTAAGDLYLSHLPGFGLAVAGPDAVAAGAVIQLSGTYHAPGDPGSNALLVEILSGAREEWVAAGNPGWTVLSELDAAAFIAAAAQLPVGHAAIAACVGAGAPMTANVAATVGQLQAIDASLYEVIKLPAALSAGLIAGANLEQRQFAQIVEIFRRRGLAAMLSMVNPGNEVHVVCSVASLPEVGVNLGERTSTGLRWYVVRIGGPAGVRATIHPFGSRTTLTGASAGLLAVVCLGYVRRGFCDPYEYRVEPEPGKLLNLNQYEYLMNFLEQTFPLGIEVNTFELRKFFVDLDADGVADPLSTAISKTYRKYYNPRMRGNYVNEEKSDAS